MSKVICWWSGGITSAVACKLAINIYGKENCKVIFIDTKNEHEDTYRFKNDCAKWYGLEIETLSAIGDKFNSIEEVWYYHKSLNTANGAICSSTLKKNVRVKWQKNNGYDYQVFGFEFDTKEFKRAVSLKLNYPDSKPIYPLIMYAMNKQDCIDYANKNNIELPSAYKLGFHNNNCLKSGCVQGGIGYWQKIAQEKPELYDKMAKIEHDLTDLKGEPVTMLKDQGKESVKKAKELGLKRKYLPLFLKPHADYPYCDVVTNKKAREVKPLNDCNGFCGVNDLIGKNETEMELNNERD